MDARDKYDIANFLEKHGWASGEYSDITLDFRGESFKIAEKKLHRVVLAQSPYFQALFSGGFKESSETRILVQIDDSNITEEAVLGVLNGLYNAHQAVPSDVSKLIALLSAASMFQVDFLVDTYTAKALEILDASVLCDVVSTGLRYSLDEVLDGCYAWLRNNPDAMTESGNAGRLPMDLVSDILEDDALWVFSEWDRYQIAKRVFEAQVSLKAVEAASSPEPGDCLNIFEGNETPSEPDTAAIEPEPVKERKGSLETVSQDFSSLFRLLHLWHCSSSELERIEADGLVDKEQVLDAYRYWKRLMFGALKDSDKDDLHSCRLSFELVNVVTPESFQDRRTPWFFFAGDEWQIHLLKSQEIKDTWLVGVHCRATTASGPTNDGRIYRYSRLEHKIEFALGSVTSTTSYFSGTWNFSIPMNGSPTWGSLTDQLEDFISETGKLRVIIWMKHMG